MRSRIQLAWLLPSLFLVYAQAQTPVGNGLHEAVGVNQTLEEGFGAKHSGSAITFGGFHDDADAVANAPAAMNDVNDFTFSSAHAEKFGEAKFDDFAVLIPFEANSTMGFGVARYGVSDIGGYSSAAPPQDPVPSYLFSTADYLVVAGFARRWGNLDAGGNFNFLYRHLDQNGQGIRGDAMVQYTWRGRYRAAALVKGLVPSTVRWESGYSEYERPDMYLSGAVKLPAPYFYGTLQVAGQTLGLFQKQGKSMRFLKGSSIGDALTSGSLGLDYLFDFGLALRFGLAEMASAQALSSVANFGIGYTWRQMLGVDYSFSPHPDLLSSHRIALRFTPAFSKFNGKNYRRKRQDVSPPGVPISGNQDALPTPVSKPIVPKPTPEKPESHTVTPQPQTSPVPAPTGAVDSAAPAPPATPAAQPPEPPKDTDQEILEDTE